MSIHKRNSNSVFTAKDFGFIILNILFQYKLYKAGYIKDLSSFIVKTIAILLKNFVEALIKS